MAIAFAIVIEANAIALPNGLQIQLRKAGCFRYDVGTHWLLSYRGKLPEWIRRAKRIALAFAYHLALGVVPWRRLRFDPSGMVDTSETE